MSHAHVVEDQGEVVAFLADPANHGGAPVERIDTHGAIVFLAGQRAYKVKRAVAYVYMDFSTRARRRAALADELRLNRQVTPEIYLHLVPLVRGPDGRLAFGAATSDADAAAATDAVEWVLVMRRFAQEDLLDRMAERGALTPAVMEVLAAEIVDFHARAEPRPQFGGVAGVRRVIDDNIDEMGESPDVFAADRVALFRRLNDAALERLGPLLDRRKRDGLVRLCHGDLHLRNIVLLEGRPRLFDRIEFDEDIAALDVLNDLAFLLMDLDHRRLRGFGNLVFNRYLEVTRDFDGLAALPLFLSTRAGVRAKVSRAMAQAQADRDKAARLDGEARDYLELAIAYLRPPPARIVAVGGLSGTGKSTVAQAIAPDIGPAPGAMVLRSDAIRKRLMGVAPTVRLPDAAYASEVSARVYATMLQQAARVVAAGHAVVLDATFTLAKSRDAAETMAAQAGVSFTGLWLEADSAALVRRVAARSADASDATPAVVRRQLDLDIGALAWHRVPAGGDRAATLAAVRRCLTEG